MTGSGGASWLAAWAVLFLLGTSAAMLLQLTLGTLIVSRRNIGYRLLQLAGCYIVIFNVIFIGDWVNPIAGLLVFLPCVWFSCEGSAHKRLTLGLLLACTVMAFSGFYDNGIDILIGHYKSKWHHDLFCSAGRALFALVLYLEVRSQKPDREFELSEPLWRLMLSLAVPCMGIEIALVFFRSPFIDRGTILSDGVLFLVVIFSFRGLLRALKVLEGQQRLERENALALINRNYYDSLEQQQFEVRRLRHDLASHLQVLLTLPEPQRDSYIEEMLEEPAFVKNCVYCGDSTVNAVLAVKEGMMRLKGIQLRAKVDIADELPFEGVDLCALFANGLDNAAEGCAELSEALREVLLEAKADRGMLAVEIRNPVPGGNTRQEDIRRKNAGAQAAGRKRDGLPVTTKTDGENHGYGLRSIRQVVRKYRGNMEIRQQEGEFVLFFYLLFPEK